MPLATAARGKRHPAEINQLQTTARTLFNKSAWAYDPGRTLELFRSAGRKTGQLTTNPLFQQCAPPIIFWRAKAAGIETRIGNHTFCATGITAYLETAVNSKSRSRSRTTNRRARPNSTTAGRTRSRSTKSSGLRFEDCRLFPAGH